MSAPTFPVSVVFHSDWGVSTGVGVVGGVDAAVEKDERGLPVVRGTVLAGVVREQSVLAAQALDGRDTGPWHEFASELFGSEQAPRLVVFSDARVPEGAAADRAPVHEIVSLSIDDDTGTAREDFLRFIERAGACALVGEAALVDVDADGRPLTWDEGQQRAAELLLALSGLLVRGIGSDRSNGDGACDVLIGAECGSDAATAGGEDDAAAAKKKVKNWCREQVGSWAVAPGAEGASATKTAPGTEEATDPVVEDLAGALEAAQAHLAEVTRQRDMLAGLLERARQGMTVSPMPTAMVSFFDRLEAAAPDERTRAAVRRERDVTDLACYRGQMPPQAEALFHGPDPLKDAEALAAYGQDPACLSDEEVARRAGQAVGRLESYLDAALLRQLARTVDEDLVRSFFRLLAAVDSSDDRVTAALEEQFFAAIRRWREPAP